MTFSCHGGAVSSYVDVVGRTQAITAVNVSARRLVSLCHSCDVLLQARHASGHLLDLLTGKLLPMRTLSMLLFGCCCSLLLRAGTHGFLTCCASVWVGMPDLCSSMRVCFASMSPLGVSTDACWLVL